MENNQYKVLVVDDEYWIRENIRGLLDWEAYSLDFLEPACDGADALLKLSHQRVDILITDMDMPFLNGVEVIKHVIKEYPHVVVIALSGYSDFGYVRDALVAGAIDYLLKPLSKMDLVRILTKALEIISYKISEEKEKKTVKEKLLAASALLQDKEFSDYIMGEFNRFEGEMFSQRMEMELNFLQYRLIVMKLICDKGQEETTKVIANIKSKLKTLFKEKTLFIHNIYHGNEYVLITELDKESVERLTKKATVLLSNEVKGCVNLAISKQYTFFMDMHHAYGEAVNALMCKRYINENTIIWTENVSKMIIIKRVSAEHENRFLFALQTKNKVLLKEIVLKHIGFSMCKTWLHVEVRQTAEHLSRLIINDVMDKRSSMELLAIENLIELFERTIELYQDKEVFFMLDQLLEECIGLTEVVKTNETVKETVAQIKEYIAKNYFEELSLTSLSQMFLVESSYLSKAFKKETNYNLMFYIAKCRIDQAKLLIKEKELTLTEIANLIGYEDYAYFNRVFRKMTNYSPREYKNIP